MIEKEELLKQFGEKIGEPDSGGEYEKIGISTRTLDAYVEAISKNGIEEVSDDFFATHISILESMGGQLRKAKADFVKSYTAEWEAKNQPTQKPTQEPQKGNAELDTIKSQLQEMLEANSKLTERLNAWEVSKKNAETSQQIADAMKQKGATDAYVLKNVLSKMQMQEGKSIEEMVDAMMIAYDEELKECRGTGAAPRMGGSGGTGQTPADRYFAQKWDKSN